MTFSPETLQKIADLEEKGERLKQQIDGLKLQHSIAEQVQLGWIKAWEEAYHILRIQIFERRCKSCKHGEPSGEYIRCLKGVTLEEYDCTMPPPTFGCLLWENGL